MTLKAHASNPLTREKPTTIYPSIFVFPTRPKTNGGGGRIRTFEGVSRQIYSLLPLAAWVPLPGKTSRVFSCRPLGVSTAIGAHFAVNFEAHRPTGRVTHIYRALPGG